MLKLYREICIGGGVAWALLIYLTSCTVIQPQEFFAWIHEHLLIHDGLFQRFQVFWGVAWFAVVKSWHALEFAILFRLVLAAMNGLRPSGHSTGQIGWFIVICLVFAVSDE